MFTWTLETMDPDEESFQRYLTLHGITAQPTGHVFAQPGGGEEVVYKASTREALESMYRYFFNSGDDESTAEDFARIEETEQ